MQVRDLISLLRQQNPDAVVVIPDHGAHATLRVARLRVDDVQPMELGSRESNGMLIFEPWTPDEFPLDGPVPGVMLGSP